MPTAPASGRPSCGNPAAELPAYPSPLRATGEGLGLTVSNEHFSAELSASHGGLRTLRVHGDPGIVLTAVGNGHGEEPGFDWGNGGDFLDRAPEGTPGWQKFRTTKYTVEKRVHESKGDVVRRMRRLEALAKGEADKDQ